MRALQFIYVKFVPVRNTISLPLVPLAILTTILQSCFYLSALEAHTTTHSVEAKGQTVASCLYATTTHHTSAAKSFLWRSKQSRIPLLWIASRGDSQTTHAIILTVSELSTKREKWSGN